jgi:hypothetical protein
MLHVSFGVSDMLYDHINGGHVLPANSDDCETRIVDGRQTGACTFL